MANFTLYNDSVWYSRGSTNSNKIAAFDLENTFIWSDSGLIYMRTEDDWVPTTNIDKLVTVLMQLIRDLWTIVIFTNQKETNEEYTEKSKRRVNNFISILNQKYVLEFNPWIFIAIRDDDYRKPNPAMWNLFLTQVGKIPGAASFYCGDAIGKTEINPLYQWSDHDSEFAHNCNLTIYNPEEILGTFTPIDIKEYDILLIMAADKSQYSYFTNELQKNNGLGTHYIIGKLGDISRVLQEGRKIIVVGERFANILGRKRVNQYIPKELQNKAAFLMFTRPVKPFAANWNKIAAVITGYANALDVHLKFDYVRTVKARDLTSRIIRIN